MSSFNSLRRQMDDVMNQMMLTHPNSAFFFEPVNPYFDTALDLPLLTACASCTPQQMQGIGIGGQQQQQLQSSGGSSTSSTDQQLQPRQQQQQLQQFSPGLVRVDVHEDPKSFEIIAEVPGVPKENVNVHIENGCLVVSGEKKEEKFDEKDQGGRVIRRQERRYGSFSRSFKLPPNAESSKVTANYNQGVLRLTIPKAPEKEQAKQKIAIQ